MLDGGAICGTGNPVDDCWRCDPSWASNRQRLADCAVGFGSNAGGGKNGRSYVVTDPGDSNDPSSDPAPAPSGTASPRTSPCGSRSRAI
jgi:pectate lyase